MGVCVKCGASSECITMIQYYVRAAYSFAAGNLIYHCLQKKYLLTKNIQITFL